MVYGYMFYGRNGLNEHKGKIINWNFTVSEENGTWIRRNGITEHRGKIINWKIN